MPEARPNILLITTDQQRGDCLGIENHPVLQTPNLDYLGRSGAQFRRAYAECPSCIAARRSIHTGTAPATHGMVGYKAAVEWSPAHTLAGELSKAGYQTEMIGKLHLHPWRKRYGFQHMVLADAPRPFIGEDNDYVTWLGEQGRKEAWPGVAHGVASNGWVGRPTHLPEEMTHTFWCVNQAIRFLEARDPSAPFFLNVSLYDPHPPLAPPAFYYDRYIQRDLPEPFIGDWAEKFNGPQRGLNPESFRIHLDEHQMRCCRAAYYGTINFIDDQIGRLMHCVPGMGNTFILFTSDHGEMLGDHNLFRKTFAYEPSARVPFLIRPPRTMGLPSGLCIDRPVGLQDIMPTLLDVAGVPIPETCTGKSLMTLIRGEKCDWRPFLHGEHSPCYSPDNAMHFLTDGRAKYIWNPCTGREQLFDLERGPNELHDLAMDANPESHLAPWRRQLIETLKGRPEGFVDTKTGKLVPGRPYEAVMPDYRPDRSYPFL